MKRFFLSLMVMLIAVISFGQTQLPVDENVRIGKLDNGMTYYIRHNDKPAQRAEFYLATNVGAFQEADDQDGLAHFLEHMCFNGTKNFPDKALLDYLRSIGAEFGRNINASTGFEQTQYMLNNIPIVREGIIDSCLLVLHDYAHYVTCDPKEIDAERGVILEERRSRRDADWRMFERSLPYYFGDTQMARRTLIGGEEQLKTFKYESLTNFYRKWYNPDMQAVVVVGDVDVDQIEQKIKNTFSSIPAAAVPTVKPIIPVPGNAEPVVAVITDPEASSSMVELLWRSEAMPKELASTDAAFVLDIVKAIISNVFSERMDAVTASVDAPFIGGGLSISALCEGCEAVQSQVMFKDGEYAKAIKAFYTEIERMRRYGITESELERAKTNLISRAEKAVEAAESRKNAEFVWPILGHFFQNKYLLTPEMKLQMTQAICAQLPSAIFQQVIAQAITEENFVVLYKAPEREGLAHPTQDEILSVINEVKAGEIAAPVEEGANEPLLDVATIAPGSIKKERIGAFGSKEWMLSNGVKVVYMPTTLKNDQVIFELVKNGGSSLIETAEIPSLDENVWALYTQNRGLSKFNGVQLRKMLTGKNVSCGVEIETTRHAITGVSTPKDLETAMQLLYLNIMEPRFDNEEYMIGVNQLKAMLPNLEKQPMFKFQKYANETLYGGNERRTVINAQDLEKANITDVENVYRRLFGDVAGATLYVVGNVDNETLKPLVEKYVASLTAGKKGTKAIDRKEYLVKGEVVKDFPIEMETPKSTVLQLYSAKIPATVENEVLLEVAKQYLDIVYVETLCESESGTYGASVATALSREPREFAIIQVAFETNPESAKKLADLAITGMYSLVEDGIPADKLDMIIKNIKKNIPQRRIENYYWMSNLQKYANYGIDYDAAYDAAVNAVTSDAVVAVMKSILEQSNFIQVSVSPAE
ncbi:MAG: insulinase family protein [Bacteroidaceae bacterium]|nr:insulinase family protein [Bacteroidaceae bacterium]